jgi:hypothetical protein
MSNLLVRFHFPSLRNKAHAEFTDDFKAIVQKHGPGDLGITTLFSKFLALQDEEIALLELIFKSEITRKIEEQDTTRDEVYRGLVAAVDAAVHHFDATKREAAITLKSVVDHYGNLTRLTYDEESAGIKDLLRELALPAHAPLATALSLGEWTTRLGTVNDAFVALMMERYEEVSQRPKGRLRVVREEVDKVLHEILDRVEAVVLLNGIDFSEELKPFVDEYNALASRYKNILARERGRRAAGKEGDVEELPGEK